MNSLSRAVRALRQSPGFTAIAVITLAFGIGANTAMFSVLNALVVRPLPFTHSAELVRLWRTSESTQRGGFSPADYLDLQRADTGPGAIAAYYADEVALSGAGFPAETGRLTAVSANMFPLLDVQPAIGRQFHPEEDDFGNHRVVLLNHALWQDRFGGAADVVGRTIRIDGEPHEIIGVLPAWATSRRPFQSDLFRPLGLSEAQRASRTTILLNLIGRRGPGVSPERFAGVVAAFGGGLAADFPEANAGTGWRSEALLASGMSANGRLTVGLLLGLSASVLLIACSNLANFLLARTMARTRELAVRAALGASRWRLLLPLAWESLLLALAGGAAALLVARWTTAWISAQSAHSGGNVLELPLDWRVLGFALAAALVTALVFGVAPSLLALRMDLNAALKSGTRSATASRGHQRLRSALIVGQFALAMIVLAGAGFCLGGSRHLIQQEFGWSTDHVAQGRLELPRNRYPDAADITAFQSRALDRLEAVPGVEAASFSYNLPYSGFSGTRRYVVDGLDSLTENDAMAAAFNGVSPDYFAVTDTRLLMGRVFTGRDDAASPRVVVISDSLARALFPDANALGRRIARDGSVPRAWMEIVGVAADVRTVDSSQAPTTCQVYHPVAQEPWHTMSLAVRSSAVTPEALLAPMRRAIASLDPDLPVSDLMTAEQRFARTASDLSFISTLLGGLAVLALGLAALGLYGVVARSVAQRTGEFGIRFALGAQVRHVVGLVLAAGVRLVLVGAALGFLGGVGLIRVLASAMPGLRTSSTVVLISVVVVLVAIALLAACLPARRAARISPLAALRAE